MIHSGWAGDWRVLRAILGVPNASWSNDCNRGCEERGEPCEEKSPRECPTEAPSAPAAAPDVREGHE